LHVLIITGVSIRIILARLPVTVSLAWLILVFFLPLVGAIAYLVLGEKRPGRQFADRTRAIKARNDRLLQDLLLGSRSDTKGLSPVAQYLSRLAESTVNIPALSGNRIQLLDAAEPILSSMIKDIDRAKRFCHLEFYIWTQGGLARSALSKIWRGSPVRCCKSR
jgi:cardiolipin synthase